MRWGFWTSLWLLLVLQVPSETRAATQDRISNRPPGVTAAQKIKNLRLILNNDLLTRKIFENFGSQAELDRSIRSVGKASKGELRERKVWVPLGIDPEVRKITVGTVLRKMNEQSDALKQILKAQPSKVVYDTLFVGAGVHSAIFTGVLGRPKTGTPPRMITVEAGTRVAATFARLGATVARNSANRAEEHGGQVRRGFGQKSPSYGPWSDADFYGSEWPPVGGLADVATINLFTSGSDFLMQSKITQIEERGRGNQNLDWPARYRVTTSDGIAVFVNQIVVSTGPGIARLPDLDTNSLALVNAELAKLDDTKPDQVPGIVTYEGALTLANLSDIGRDPYRNPPVPLQPPPTKAERIAVGGTRVTVSLPTRIEVVRFQQSPGIAPREPVDISEVTGFSYDPQSNGAVVELTSGEKVQADALYALVNYRGADYRVSIQPKETLEAFANRLRTISISGATGNVSLKVDVSARTRRAAANSTNAQGTQPQLPASSGSTYVLPAVNGGQYTLTNVVDAFVLDGRWIVKTADGRVLTGDPKRLLEVSSGQPQGAGGASGTGSVAVSLSDPRYQRRLTGPARRLEEVRIFVQNAAATLYVQGQQKGTGPNNGYIPLSDVGDVSYSASGWTVRLNDGREGQYQTVYAGSAGSAGNYPGLPQEPFKERPEDAAAAAASTAGSSSSPATAPRRLKIAVIGGNDGGKTFLEYLYGQAPEPAYTGNGKHDVAQRGEIGDVEWVVGPDGPADCDAFLQKTRSRYLRLAGKVRVVDGSEPRAKLVAEKLVGVSLIQTGADTGRYQLTYANRNNVRRMSIADRIVLATGIENQLGKLLGTDQAAALEPVKGRLPGKTEPKVIGKQVRGQDIYVVGPAAGNDVAGEDELYSTKENAASIYIWAKRVIALARQKVAAGPRSTEPFQRPEKVAPKALQKGQSAPNTVALAKPTEISVFARTSFRTVLIKSELADLLDQFRFPGIGEISLTIGPKSQKEKGVLFLNVPELDEASVRVLGTKISQNPTLMRELADLSLTGNSLRIDAKIRPDTQEAARQGEVLKSTIRVSQ